MSSRRRDIAESLSKVNWEELYPRLRYYVEWKLRTTIWAGIRGGPPPKGVGPNDIIHQAVYKVLSGERAWNEEVPLDVFLFHTIRSEISNLASSKENKLLKRGEDIVNRLGGAKHKPLIQLANISGQVENQSTLGTTPSITEEENKKEKERILKEFQSSSVLIKKIVKLIIDDDIYKSRDIADCLNVSVEEIYNAKRVIRRKLLKIKS